MLESLYEAKSDTKLSAGVVMKKYVEYWINRQQSKRIQSAFHGNEIKKLEFIQTFFTELAVDFYISDKFKMSADEIILRVNKLITFWNLQNFEKAENLEGFQQEILTGYFIEREDDDYKFVHKSFFEFFIASKIIELLQAGNFKDKLMYKTWSLEIIDFVYDTIPDKHQKIAGVPALLSLSNSKILAKLKLIHFCLDIELNRFFSYLMKFFVPTYFLLTPFVIYINFGLLVKDGNNKDHGISQALNMELWYLLISLFISAFIISLIIRKLNKIKLFTTKSVILSISKNEISSSHFVRKIFGISELTIKILNIKINKIYPAVYRRFENSILENVTFTNCDFQGTYFYDSYLKDVDFSGSKIHRMSFINCQLDNVDFSQSKKIKYTKFSILFSGNIFNTLRFLKSKKGFNYILNFAEMTPSQFDKKTLDSLKVFISKNNLEINTDIIAEDWLIKILQ